MRLIILSMLFCLSMVNANSALAKVDVYGDCKQQYQGMVASSFVLFSKKELMELGTCTGVALLKRNRLSTLVYSCNEAQEARSVFGIATLSKAEAIQVGQCVGVINYIYDRYDGERLDYSAYRRSNYVYSCIRGRAAVDLLSKEPKRSYGRNTVRDLLCDRH
ncbi:MAG: hypothetical protein HRU25_02655 [Psychrobium sp.]|nr:hypothetical protein [Psychrobium sp.]